MRLLNNLTGRAGRQHGDNATAQQFQSMVAHYGRNRHVQPWAADSSCNHVAIPEEPFDAAWLSQSRMMIRSGRPPSSVG